MEKKKQTKVIKKKEIIEIMKTHSFEKIRRDMK